MSRPMRTVLWMALIGLVLAALGIGVVIAWGGEPLAHAVVSIDGREITLGQLHGHVVPIAVAALVAMLVVFLVVPLALLLPLLATGLALAIALAAIAGTVALLLSPLLLLGWLAWRLTRPGRSAAADATQAIAR